MYGLEKKMEREREIRMNESWETTATAQVTGRAWHRDKGQREVDAYEKEEEQKSTHASNC